MFSITLTTELLHIKSMQKENMDKVEYGVPANRKETGA